LCSSLGSSNRSVAAKRRSDGVKTARDSRSRSAMSVGSPRAKRNSVGKSGKIGEIGEIGEKTRKRIAIGRSAAS
jgi:hypothetical protein